ncbi:hypothetical protein NL460_29545, partial [Klebsiella pneumoniae]|nr:hypothetical protein [Klebsiella pneumoniae]
KAALAALEATVPLFQAGPALGAHDPATWDAMVGLLSSRGLLGGEVDPAAAWTDQFLPGASN